MLNTTWKTWDKYLNRFAGKKITVIELGVYLGDSTFWFLDNLLTHPESKIYSIDTFEGSPEYGIDFTIVKHKFVTQLAKHKDKHKVCLIPTYSHKALKKLDGVDVDVAYIDASHVASDVITDAVLLFPMLKPGGIIIFDDYLWTKISPISYTPKPAIDAFMNIYKPYIKVLHVKRQVFIEKLPKERHTPAIVSDEQKITDICDFLIDLTVRAEQITLVDTIAPPTISLKFAPATADANEHFITPDCIPIKGEDMNIMQIKDGITINMTHILYFLQICKGLEGMDKKCLRYFHYSFVFDDKYENYHYKQTIEQLFAGRNPGKKLDYIMWHKGKESKNYIDLFGDYKRLVPCFGKNDFVFVSLPIYGVDTTGMSREKINAIPTFMSILYNILLCRVGGNIMVHMLDCHTAVNVSMLYLLKSYFKTVRVEINAACMSKCKVSFFVYCFDLQRSGAALEKYISPLAKAQYVGHPDIAKNKIKKILCAICKVDAQFAAKVLEGMNYESFLNGYVTTINRLCKFKNKELFLEIYKSRLFKLIR